MNKSKIAFIFSPIFPFPLSHGSHIDIFGHIVLLQKKGYEILLFTFGNKKPKQLNFFQSKYGLKEIIYINTSGDLINSSIYTKWYTVKPLFTKRAREIIQTHINELTPELLFFEYAAFAPLVQHLKTFNAKVLFRSHNFELMHNIEKELIKNPNIIAKALFLLSRLNVYLSVYLCEYLMFKIAHLVLSISDGDIKSFKKYYLNPKNIDYLPPYFPKIKKHFVKNKNKLNVFYLGSDFHNNVNLRGGELFTHQVIPAILSKLNNKFNFYIIGKNSEKYFKGDNKNIFVYPYVDNLDLFLENMDICCIPIDIGRGCKIKMYDALARGFPTIGYDRAFYGIPGVKDCYITTHNDEQLIKGFEFLLDKKNRENLSLNAYKMISRLNDKLQKLTL